MNQKLMVAVLRILKHRIKNTNNAQAKSAYILANNLLIYALQGNEKKINEYLEKEGLN